MRRYALPLLILTAIFMVVLLASPYVVHSRLEAELSRSLGLPVHFSSIRLRGHGADLRGLKIGDFLTADEVDAYISWTRLDLHPTRLVLKKPVLRLDGEVIRTLREGRKPGRKREFALVFEEGRLRLFGLADIYPVHGEWGADHSLTLEHPQGGRWKLANSRLTVEGASLVTLASWVGRQLPLDPAHLLNAALAFGPPAQGQLDLPWGKLELTQEGQGLHLHSPSLGPLSQLSADFNPRLLTADAHAQLSGAGVELKAAWKGQLQAELQAARVQLGEVEVRGLDFDLHGSRLHGTIGETTFRKLAIGPAELDLVLGPQLEGELRLARPLALETAQAAGLAPRIGFIRLGNVRLQGLSISGSLAAPRLAPRF